MPARINAAPFWPPPPRPATSADTAALATIARFIDGRTAPAATPVLHVDTLPVEACPELVRAGGRIVGMVLPFPADGEGPIYTPVRGPARIRELVDDGIIV